MKPTRYLNIRDQSIAFYQHGKGKFPLIFVHGNSQQSDLFYHQFQSFLSEKYRLIAFDFPGHGESSKSQNPELTYSFENLRNIISDIIIQVNDPVVLIGHSLGGHLALEAASFHPESVKGLFISGTPPIGTLTDLTNAYLPATSSKYLYQENVADEELNELTDAGVVNKAESDLIIASIKKADGKFRTITLQQIIAENFLNEKEIIGNILFPVAIAEGEIDPFVNKEYFHSFSIPSLWQASINIVPKSGHWPFLDNPLFYNRLIDDFVQSLN